MRTGAFSLFVLACLWSRPADAVSLKNFRELAAFYSAATGVPLTEPAVKQAYQNVRTRLPRYGHVDEMSSPAVLGAIELGSAFCTAMISSDAALPSGSRRAHEHIDFSKAPRELSRNDLLDTIDNYASLFWQRDTTDGEGTAFGLAITALKSMSANSVQGTQQMLVVLCTQVATSLDALVNP